MRLRTKWLLVSVAGAALLTIVLFSFFAYGETPLNSLEGISGPLGVVAKAVLWPVDLCLQLSGPGPNLGPPEKHQHEWTPVQHFAVILGVGVSWGFYSSVVFLMIWLLRRRRKLKVPALQPVSATRDNPQ